MEDLDYWVKMSKDTTDGAIPLFEIRAFEVKQADGSIDYEDRIYVTILNRGDSNTQIERWLRPEDEERWAPQLEAFRKQTEPPVDGTPITEWPALTPADHATLKKKHVRTLEELVALPDTELKGLRRGISMKVAAQQFLEYRGDPIKLSRQVEELTARLKALEAENEELKDGNSTDDGAERAAGDRVSEPVDAGGEQQRRSKKGTKAAKKKRKQASA